MYLIVLSPPRYSAISSSTSPLCSFSASATDTYDILELRRGSSCVTFGVATST
ncbi:hypothetical protein PC116_g27326 [Phytophthora cactorum]|nr:hypothetical protein PI125_g24566 [Phytophthora idaei]KAG4224218.1 hypothetical protein PC116_g27326 [Phytophthora cactorum]